MQTRWTAAAITLCCAGCTHSLDGATRDTLGPLLSDPHSFWALIEPEAARGADRRARTVLASDSASAEQWTAASLVLARRAMGRSEGFSLAGGAGDRSSPAWNAPSLHALLLSRIERLLATRGGALRVELNRQRAALVTLSLLELGPSLSVLQQVSALWQRASVADPLTIRAAALVYEARALRGATDALPEYLDWLATLDPAAFSLCALEALRLAIDCREDARVQSALARLLREDRWRIFEHYTVATLYQSEALRIASVREHFARLLSDRSPLGTLLRDGTRRIVDVAGRRPLQMLSSRSVSRQSIVWRRCDETLFMLFVGPTEALWDSSEAERDLRMQRVVEALRAPDRGQWSQYPVRPTRDT